MLDDPAFHPILDKAEELGAPVYIHLMVLAFAQVKGYGFALAGDQN